MRLLLVIPTIDSYQPFFGELCSELTANGAEVHVACVLETTIGPQHPTLDPCVHFHPLRLPRGMNPFGHLRAARALEALVSKVRPDIVHAHFSATIFTAALARRKTWPVTLGTLHGLSFPFVKGLKSRVLRAAESWAASRFDTVWVLTQDDRAQLDKAAPSAAVKTVQAAGLGCDLEKFRPESVSVPERKALRERLRIEPYHCVFIFVGRFVAFKGFDLTVRTFLRIAGTNPRLRLLLVGGFDRLHPSGLTLAEDHARKNCTQIIDVGYTDHVASYLAISHAMVFPSQREGMPVCLMEALAMGVPVITRASRGCRDVVRHDRDGLVLSACTVDTLGAEMKRLAQDDGLLCRLSSEALAGRQRFDRCIFIREQIDVYRQYGGFIRETPLVASQDRARARDASGELLSSSGG